jgi:hypothetical protein
MVRRGQERRPGQGSEQTFINGVGYFVKRTAVAVLGDGLGSGEGRHCKVVLGWSGKLKLFKRVVGCGKRVWM